MLLMGDLSFASENGPGGVQEETRRKVVLTKWELS